LSTITESKLVVSTIAQTLGVKEAAGQPIIETLKAYLRGKKLLLLLDNFEQVSDAAREVSHLLAACPKLKVLATSRVPLRIKGEKEYAVSPLELPDIKHLPSLDRLTQYEAVRLFIERATDVKADFQVTNENAPSVAEICTRLDGLPLAIELAAARIKMLPPHALLTRLSNRLKVLTGGARDVSARQQTLRGAIDWSYNLLDEGQKQLFRRMAVFSGGRTLEALEAVCNSEGLQVGGQLEVDVFDGVEALLSNSLLQQREGLDGEPRFWMLQTIHEYAREKLEESVEGEEIARGHVRFFLALAERAEPELRGPRIVEWLDRLEEEHDNLRAALRWCREHDQVESGLRIAGAIWKFWRHRSYWTEGQQQISLLLSTGDPDRLKALLPTTKALYGAGDLAFRQGHHGAARARFRESLEICEHFDDKKGIALALNGLGNVADSLDERLAFYEQSLAIRREIGDRIAVASSLGNIAAVLDGQGDLERALSFYGESITILREQGDKGSLAP
jgi:predicted ATPase